MNQYADLHLHTNASDGEFSPAEVVLAAQKCGLTTIAITDHDTIFGIQKARQASLDLGIEFISGIEISTDWQDNEIHILGYFLEDAEQKFYDKLEQMQRSRAERSQKMVKALNDLGYLITMENVQKIAGSGTIGRPHLARALLEKEYVQTIKEAFIRFLGVGCPAYIPRFKITPFEAIVLLKEIKAIPVLAHPGLSPNDNLIGELIRAGLLGIEVWHPEHNQSAIQKYYNLACEYNLLLTGGSDWHGHNKDYGSLGSIQLGYQYILALRSKREQLKSAKH